MKKELQIAIDGPVGSGKGTLAVALAKKLNATHIYTGGMYRALALNCVQTNSDINNEEAVLNLLKNSNIELEADETSGFTRILLNGIDVTHDIFLPKVSNITPIIAAHKTVREEMVKRQKEIVEGKRVIVEGRDISTVVMPNADIKIFLNANVDERAKRRFRQLKEKNVDISMEEVKNDVIRRDMADSDRKASPMERTHDSFLVDTTNDTIEDTMEKVLIELKKRDLI